MISVLETRHRGTVFTARLTDVERLRHLYIVGRPGMGKTGLVLHMIEQDVAEKKLFLCFDSQGIIAQAVLGKLSPVEVFSLQDSFFDASELSSFQYLKSKLQTLREKEGKPDAFVSVYIDSLAQIDSRVAMEILNHARELNIALVLVHRYISELSVELFGRIIDAVRYGIFFSVGPRDAQKIASWIPDIPVVSWGPQLKERQVFTNLVLRDSALPLFRAETIAFEFPPRSATIQERRTLGGPVGIPEDVLKQLFAC